jgi:hypothetical protein
MVDFFKDLKARGKYTPIKNTFLCLAYNKGKKRMLDAGASKEQAADFARQMSAKASKIWDELP